MSAASDEHSGEHLPVEKRKFELAIDLRTDAEAVWRALTDAEELSRWFPLSARVRPGLGGSIFISWGPACEGEAPITLWEDGRALAFTETHEGGAVKVVVEFHIEPKPQAEQGVVVRVVQHGFGRGAKWEDYYDSIASGWKYEMRSLRHYLERHAGVGRVVGWSYPRPSEPRESRLWRLRATSLRCDEAWARFMGMGGICASDKVGTLKEGDRYRFETASGDVLEGRVVLNHAPLVFSGTLESLNDALMRVMIEPTGGRAAPGLWVSAWGVERTRVLDLQDRWDERLTALFGDVIDDDRDGGHDVGVVGQEQRSKA